MLLTLSQTGIQPAVRPLDQIPVLDDRPLAVLARAARLRRRGALLLVRDEKEDKKVKNIEGPIDVLISASAAAMRLEEDRDCARARTLEIRFLKQEHDRVARRCAEKLEAQAEDALPNAAKELSEAARSIREGFGL